MIFSLFIDQRRIKMCKKRVEIRQKLCKAIAFLCTVLSIIYFIMYETIQNTNVARA